MKKFGRLIETRGAAFLRAAGLMAIAVALGFGLACATPSRTQGKTQGPAQAAFSWKYKYDVVSVKPLGHNDPSQPQWGYLSDTSPDGIRIRRATLVSLARFGYSEGGRWGFRDNQIFGAPNWASTEWFAIDAKMDESVASVFSKLSPAQQTLAQTRMLQEILVERFKFAAHIENREGPVYFLTVAKGGLKFKKAPPGETYPKGPFEAMPWQAGWVVTAPPDSGSEKRIGLGADMIALADDLTRRLHIAVVDKTGLTGKYDFQLQWSGIDAIPTESDAPWPPLLTAIQQQMGLKLEMGKGQTPVLVIDHVERPSGN
jgi:uncharacterized protein (TIGR03435 family)